MTKDEMMEGILRSCGISKANIERFYDGLVKLTMRELVNHGEMVLPGLGTLRAVTLKARVARNPATGEPVQVPRKRTARFRPHKELREVLNPGSASGTTTSEDTEAQESTPVQP